ncbi:MAG TPA: hypothetical protein V6D25_09980 [Leptolyngbyaceae cyanobacterium]
MLCSENTVALRKLFIEEAIAQNSKKPQDCSTKALLGKGEGEMGNGNESDDN